MLAIGRDAAVGIVPPDAVPPGPGEMVALMAEGPALMARGAPALLVMGDGQRFPGSIEERDGVATWRSAWCAPRPMDLDGVRGISFGDGDPPPASDTDVVLLRNGDRRSGVVTAVGAKFLLLEEASGEGRSEVKVPIESVVAVGLAGPAPERSGVRVWVADGSVIDAPRVAWLGPEYLQLPGRPGARTESVTIPRAAVVAMQADPGSVVSLSSMVPTASVPAGAAGVPYAVAPPAVPPGPSPLDAPTLDVEGPVRLSYPAAAHPQRLLATVRRPEPARAAGDVDLVVCAGGKELHRERLDAGRSSVELRIDLPGGPFELLLLPVQRSAAGCHVLLERAILCRR